MPNHCDYVDIRADQVKVGMTVYPGSLFEMSNCDPDGEKVTAVRPSEEVCGRVGTGRSRLAVHG